MANPKPNIKVVGKKYNPHKVIMVGSKPNDATLSLYLKIAFMSRGLFENR